MLVQIYWANPKIWLHLVPFQKLLCRHKNQFYWMQIIFLLRHKILVTATICKYLFCLAQKLWTSPKHFRTCKRTWHKLLFRLTFKIETLSRICVILTTPKTKLIFFFKFSQLSQIIWTLSYFLDLPSKLRPWAGFALSWQHPKLSRIFFKFS